MTKWFSYDGCSVETHETSEEAKARAEQAMEDWRDDARFDGWDECSLQVCWGRVEEHAEVTSRSKATELDVDPDGAGEVETHGLVRQHEEE